MTLLPPLLSVPASLLLLSSSLPSLPPPLPSSVSLLSLGFLPPPFLPRLAACFFFAAGAREPETARAALARGAGDDGAAAICHATECGTVKGLCAG